jgi:major membrane immunogen (membrane-anchored lipoprotein)
MFTISKKTVAALGLATLMLSACGPSTAENAMERQIEKETGQDADVDMKNDGSMMVKTDEGTMQTGNTLPADWPTDVEIYAGATVSWSATTNQANGKAGSAIVFTTGDSEQAVVDFYKKSMKDNGWTVQTTMQTGEGVVLVANKDKRALSLSVVRTDEGTTTVTLGVGEQG